MRSVRILLGLSKADIKGDLTVANWKELGWKSPKLSKRLLQLGYHNNVVAKFVEKIRQLVSASSAEAACFRLTAGETDIRRQSDSAHFTSCQRTGSSLNRTSEDLEAAQKGWLYLWVYDTPGGFMSRTKVRCCVAPDHPDIHVGFFVDRTYGQPRGGWQTLVAHLGRLTGQDEVLVSFRQGSPLMPQEGEPGVLGTVTRRVTVPSSNYGYQDSLSPGAVVELTFYRLSTKVGTVGVGPLLERIEAPATQKGYRHDVTVALGICPGPAQEPARDPRPKAWDRRMRKLYKRLAHSLKQGLARQLLLEDFSLEVQGEVTWTLEGLRWEDSELPGLYLETPSFVAYYRLYATGDLELVDSWEVERPAVDDEGGLERWRAALQMAVEEASYRERWPRAVERAREAFSRLHKELRRARELAAQEVEEVENG